MPHSSEFDGKIQEVTVVTGLNGYRCLSRNQANSSLPNRWCSGRLSESEFPAPAAATKYRESHVA